MPWVCGWGSIFLEDVTHARGFGKWIYKYDQLDHHVFEKLNDDVMTIIAFIRAQSRIHVWTHFSKRRRCLRFALEPFDMGSNTLILDGVIHFQYFISKFWTRRRTVSQCYHHSAQACVLCYATVLTIQAQTSSHWVPLKIRGGRRCSPNIHVCFKCHLLSLQSTWSLALSLSLNYLLVFLWKLDNYGKDDCRCFDNLHIRSHV